MIRYILHRLFGVSNEFYPQGPWLSKITEKGFVLKRGYGSQKIRDPKRLSRIEIITNDRGPFSEDIFWKFEHPDGDFYFPASEDISGSFLASFQELEGFDNEAVSRAMGSATNNAFLVWDRNAL